MSFWEQYVAAWRHIWGQHRWILIAIFATSVLIDLIRWQQGLPYFPWMMGR